MSPRAPRTSFVFAGAVALSLGVVADARAGQPPFLPFDVQTVFYISKSDDHNRVDYGIHLDSRCSPTDNDAVYYYWREFEGAPPVRVHSPGVLDGIGYGISDQRMLAKSFTGGVHFIQLRQLPRLPVRILTTKGADGRCRSQARCTINGKESELSFGFVKLGQSGVIPSVDYVDIHGKDLQTGQEVVERLTK
jgi:Domain of unknown function (DUF4833)